MEHHSHVQIRRASRARPPDPLNVSEGPRGFLDAWNRLVDAEDLPGLPGRRGRKPRVRVNQLLPALTFHVMNGAGTLAEHFSELYGESLADSSWSELMRVPAVALM